LVDEIIIVDNDPEQQESEIRQDPSGRQVKVPLLESFAGSVAGHRCPVRYIHAPEAVGTAAPRDRVFREARGEIVVCTDSHVLFRKGSIQALLDFYDKNPESNDLIQGPMFYDSLTGFASHFFDFWRSEMWGIWGAAWRCPDCETPHAVLEEQVQDTGRVAFVAMDSPHGRLKQCPKCGREFPTPYWSGHEIALAEAGFRPAVSGEPFEIPAQGLGAFACRKESWLGFNPRFRGFGGEEFYIHRKYKKAGYKTLCLPSFQWIHRFGRPGGVKYPLTVWHKVRNYIIGHQELGMDLTPIHDHFVKTGRMPQNEWDDAVAGLEWPRGLAGAQQQGGCGGCPQKDWPQLDEWYEQVWKTPSDINEHTPTLRDYASRSESVVEFGGRRGVTTVALLAGRPKRLTSYDQSPGNEINGLQQRANGTDFRFVQGDSLYTEIEPCDLLFIDTKHTANQMYAELSRHAPKVRRWIVMHDTDIFGERGEDGGPGILPAVRAYVREHPEWTVVKHDHNNHGLMVLSRDPADRKPLPPRWKQGLNFIKATVRHKANGGTYLPLPLAEERLAVCYTCELRGGPDGGQCTDCGCWLWRVSDDEPVKEGQPGKVFYPTESCPYGYWKARPDDGVSMTQEETEAMLTEAKFGRSE
jgi:cephalosporin hydroxylase